MINGMCPECPDNDGREFDGNVNAEYSSDTSIYNYADQISYTQNNERITLIGVENGKFEKNGDYKIEKVSSLKQGSTTIVNGENVEFKNGNLTISHADSILTDNAISTNVYNFSGNSVTFHLDSAEQIISDGISFNDVINATFTADESAANLVTEEGIAVEIIDESLSQTTFEAISDDGSILVTKEIPAEYTITNGNLTFIGEDFSETITANNTITVSLDPSYGFSCMEIIPPGTYSYSENLIKDYGVHIPSCYAV